MAKKINVKLILELRNSGLSMNEIALSNHISKHSVCTVCRRAESLGLTRERIVELGEQELYSLFFPDKRTVQQFYTPVDYEMIHRELVKPGVTLKLLHQEYQDECRHHNQIAVGYSKFCEDYDKYVGNNKFANHIYHKPGDRIEVDWSGPTMHYTDRLTGKNVTVYLFCSDLVHSRLAYVEPCLSMDQQNWLQCHVNMYAYYGGVSRILVSDNLKQGVTSHPREGEIIIADNYRSLVEHYGTGLIPAAVKAPRQKNSTEGTVGDIGTGIIAKLRNREFSSFQQLQEAVRQELEDHNNEEFQKREGSRRSVFESEEREFLKPLPSILFEVGRWVYGRKVQLNSHVVFEKNFYSFPYHHIGKTVDLRVTENAVEIFLDHERVKTHVRFPAGTTNRYRTDIHDMPQGSGFMEWTPERILSWGERIGVSTRKVVSQILDARTVPEQGFNSALAVLRLANSYSSERLEKAAELALRTIRCPRYHNLKAILSSNQDESYVCEMQHKAQTAKGRLRGADYYRKQKEGQDA
ncbi:MAG: IS21 family transposase [Sphaerochaetaceae bacterium]